MAIFSTDRAKSVPAAQEFLSLEAIRDGVIVLKANAGLRAVLMASALNFALKSEEEQDALTFQYENFLNSLDFPLQVVVQSRRLDIQPYLETLAGRQGEEINDLLKVQIGEYIEFVKGFVELSQIVSKTFYVVVPFEPSVVERRAGIMQSVTSLFGGPPKGGVEAAEDEFLQFKNQLLQRVDAVALGLRRLGLRAALLATDELVELLYGLYNPSESQRIRSAPVQS